MKDSQITEQSLLTSSSSSVYPPEFSFKLNGLQTSAQFPGEQRSKVWGATV